MGRAKAGIGSARYRVDLTAAGHSIVADEPAVGDGQAAGPGPYDLLLASLGACTAITLKMYAERKGWPLDALEVDLKLVMRGDQLRIERALSVQGELDEARRNRLVDIAERTPVTLTLKGGIAIHTKLT